MATPTPTSVRLDPELKREAEKVFDALGLSPSTAITLFYKAVVREQGLPFPVTLDPRASSGSTLADAFARLLVARGSGPDAEDGADDGGKR